jgi:hypothetical protein
VRGDGTYVGRAAPEIDIFEATIYGGTGKVSQSAQWAPYNVRGTTFEGFCRYPDLVSDRQPTGGRIAPII